MKNTLSRFQPHIISLVITLIGLFAFFAKATIPFTNFLEIIDLKTIDMRFNTRGEIKPGNHVTIAAIDEKSLQEEGKWPWPRVKIADLITRLSDAGAKVIVFDVVFAEKDDTRVMETISMIQSKIKTNESDRAYLNQLLKESDYDSILSNRIKAEKNKVVLGYFFNLEYNKRASLTDKEKELLSDLITSSQYDEFNFKSEKTLKDSGLLVAQNPVSNTKIIMDSAEKTGFFNVQPDLDSIIRSFPAAIQYNDFLYAPLSLKAVSMYTGSPISLTVDEDWKKTIHIGDHTIPANRNGRILINFRGGNKTFPYVSCSDILQGHADKSLLKDRIVIVGTTTPGLTDIRSTPFGTVVPGCEIHANLIDNIMAGDILYQPSLLTLWSVLAIIIAGALMAFTLPYLGAVSGLVVYLLSAAGYWIICQLLFTKARLELNMTYPLFVLTSVYIAVTVNSFLSESKKKKFIHNAFSTYLSPAVVKQLIRSPEKLVLGGEDRHITAFFSDVEGFTSISEKLTATELVELLNEFLSEMTDIILRFEGTVDKFEGDAIIALFGAPIDLENHALNTCRACIAMHERLKILNEQWKKENRHQLNMRIGLCSGIAVVGNMGSNQRFDYTMMGDVVNTAARLEGVNKVYGTYSMISETTKTMAGPDIVTREIDTIYMVGKFEPVTVYQIIGNKGFIDETTQKVMAFYEEGLKLYKSKEFKKAITCFEKAITTDPSDGPSKTMIKRCREYLENPPGAEWNGVFRITSK